jgi:hypothetical protein
MGSTLLSGAVPQVPALLHTWQIPLHALLQHRPSTQKPEVQSVATVQVWPSADFAPHWWVTVLQRVPVVQSALVAQLVPHCIPLRQVYPPHEVTTGAGQLPLPSHAAAWVSIPAAQVWLRQLVLPE